jgi:NAD(P)-dependent dehydrogenase (short-subunit alcohol dehydrogenase family)
MSPTAVVTGAANGIGLAVAERFRDDGWRVVGLDINFGGESPDQLHADVRSRSSIESALASLDSIDAVISNAAVLNRASLAETTLEQWQETLDTNLTATFQLISVTHARLTASAGSIVAVSSVHAHATSRGASAYATSKAGLLGLVRASALELAEDGIRVNAVVPGATRTSMLLQEGPEFDRLIERTPLKRVAEPEEIASAVAFLAGKESAFVTGQAIVVDGGVLAALSTE